MKLKLIASGIALAGVGLLSIANAAQNSMDLNIKAAFDKSPSTDVKIRLWDVSHGSLVSGNTIDLGEFVQDNGNGYMEWNLSDPQLGTKYSNFIKKYAFEIYDASTAQGHTFSSLVISAPNKSGFVTQDDPSFKPDNNQAAYSYLSDPSDKNSVYTGTTNQLPTDLSSYSGATKAEAGNLDYNIPSDIKANDSIYIPVSFSGVINKGYYDSTAVQKVKFTTSAPQTFTFNTGWN
ncbi:hypothetical protein [Cysteiniphilum litorale]|uniref:hypothetical protein n=1 Tax=Cysteiniphilum litorale TaxID=2056700 RepID=UPI003F88333D